jgi:hypothetical protein
MQVKHIYIFDSRKWIDLWVVEKIAPKLALQANQTSRATNIFERSGLDKHP